MIRHYQDLLRYDTWANGRSLDSLETVPESRRTEPPYARASGLVPHILLARRIWLMRIRATQHPMPTDWFPATETSAARELAKAVDHDWTQFLAGVTEQELDREVTYTASDGTKYASTVREILSHVFNHGTYHRGQIARIVTELGGTRSATDHIIFTRSARA